MDNGIEWVVNRGFDSANSYCSADLLKFGVCLSYDTLSMFSLVDSYLKRVTRRGSYSQPSVNNNPHSSKFLFLAVYQLPPHQPRLISIHQNHELRPSTPPTTHHAPSTQHSIPSTHFHRYNHSSRASHHRRLSASYTDEPHLPTFTTNIINPPTNPTITLPPPSRHPFLHQPIFPHPPAHTPPPRLPIRLPPPPPLQTLHPPRLPHNPSSQAPQAIRSRIRPPAAAVHGARGRESDIPGFRIHIHIPNRKPQRRIPARPVRPVRPHQQPRPRPPACAVALPAPSAVFPPRRRGDREVRLPLPRFPPPLSTSLSLPLPSPLSLRPIPPSLPPSPHRVHPPRLLVTSIRPSAHRTADTLARARRWIRRRRRRRGFVIRGASGWMGWWMAGLTPWRGWWGRGRRGGEEGGCLGGGWRGARCRVLGWWSCGLGGVV